MTERRAADNQGPNRVRGEAGAATAPGTGDDASRPDLVGSVLAGRYRIVEKLGEGAMGAVYLGEHLKIGRMDAIKVLRGSLAGDQEAIARFVRGARNVSAVQHPNVCVIYDFSDTDDGDRFLAMEFVAGESLRELLEREGALPLERAVDIACQAAEGLQAAHEAGIVHRDLKPANLMIARARNGRDQVKVVDFDIAKSASGGEEIEVTRLGFVIGTPEYMAPEQLIGDRVDGRSDVFALALVLVRMLTGALPYRAESTQDMMVQRLTGSPMTLAELKPGADFPARLQAALDRALARKPEDRFASAADFAREIAATLPTRDGPRTAAGPVVGTESVPAGSGRSEIPETRLSVPPGAELSAPRGAETRGFRAAPLATAATLLLLLAAGAGWLLLGGIGAPVEEPASVATVAQPGTSATADRGSLESHVNLADSPADTGLEPTGVAPAAGEGARQPQTTPAPPGERVGSVPADPVPRRSDLTAEQASAALLRQLDLLGDDPAIRAPRRVLQAVRDTATLVWRLGDAGARDRAFAAYVLGSAWLASEDPAQCVTWLERALTLRPDGPGFQELLASCRRQSP
jgi:eukaryotic-like serine/threonine-protein kinase